MDPLWATIAEFWWIGPTLIGAGTLGWLGLRHQRSVNARRIAYDAARRDLRAARTTVTGARVSVKIARAELAQVQAERAASRASSADVATARHELQRAQRDLKSATADVRARRAHVTAARAMLPAGAKDPSALPLAKLMAAHDAVTARWLEYETDPAKLIAFPAMSDGRVRLTAVYLDERATASRLRPASTTARLPPEAYAASRDAVARLEKAFAAAEAEAWRQARVSGAVPPGSGPGTRDDPDQQSPAWTDVAQSVAQRGRERSADAIARVTEAAATAAAAATTTRATPPAAAPKSETPPPSPQPVWPVPSRSSKPRDTDTAHPGA